MEPDKVLQFFAENLADWSWITILTLRNPIARFELAPIPSQQRGTLVGGSSKHSNLWLHPKLISYSVLSIVLGIMMNSLLAGRIPGPEMPKSVAIIFAYWLSYGSLLFLACRALKGRGSYLDTLSVSIQIFAAIYVVTSFLSLVATALLSVPAFAGIIKRVPLIGIMVANEPPLVFFVIGLLLLSVYVPLSLKVVHRFGWLRTFLVFLVPVFMTLVSRALYSRIGLLMLW